MILEDVILGEVSRCKHMEIFILCNHNKGKSYSNINQGENFASDAFQHEKRCVIRLMDKEILCLYKGL